MVAPKTRNALSLEMLNQLDSEIQQDKVNKYEKLSNKKKYSEKNVYYILLNYFIFFRLIQIYDV